MVVGVIWSVGRDASRPLLKGGSFGFFYRQVIGVEKSSPAFGNGRGTPHPLDPLDPPSRAWWWKQWHWGPHQQFSSLYHLPCLDLTQDQDMHLIWVPSVQRLFGSTLICVVIGVVMKFTPLPCVLIWICGVVLSHPTLAFPLVLRFGAPFPSFGFADPKSRFFYLNLCLILAT